MPVTSKPASSTPVTSTPVTFTQGTFQPTSLAPTAISPNTTITTSGPTSSATNNAAASSSGASNGANTGTIAAVVIIILLVLLAALLVVLYKRRQNQKKRDQVAPDSSAPSVVVIPLDSMVPFNSQSQNSTKGAPLYHSTIADTHKAKVISTGTADHAIPTTPIPLQNKASPSLVVYSVKEVGTSAFLPQIKGQAAPETKPETAKSSDIIGVAAHTMPASQNAIAAPNLSKGRADALPSNSPDTYEEDMRRPVSSAIPSETVVHFPNINRGDRMEYQEESN